MISKNVGFNQSKNLESVVKLERETSDVRKKAGSGQKRIITKSDALYLKSFLHNHHASAPNLKVRFEEKCVNLSAQIIQRHLTKCSLHTYRPKEKAITYLKKDTEKTFLRKTVCFTDKSSVGLSNFFR